MLASLLHDVDDIKLFNNSDRFHNLHVFFSKYDIKDSLGSVVEKIIYSLDGKESISSIESMIVQDADNLDALGAIGLARMFAFGGAKGKVLYTELDELDDDSLSHYFKKLQNLSKTMHFRLTRKMANKRIRFMNKFVKIFLLETDIKDEIIK